MKHISLCFITAVVLVFSANTLAAQNSLVLHKSDTVITLYNVDTTYYSRNGDSAWVHHVVTYDSVYAFLVDEIDSMFYYGPEVVVNGVIRGGIPDSMLVMTMADIIHVSDSSFDVKALRGDWRQLVIVTNLDTLPLMFYRGVLAEGETVVIDTMSTVMALLSWPIPFDSLVRNHYEQFCSIAEQCDSFPLLYSLIAHSIANNRPLSDTLNEPIAEVLSMVIAQIKDAITPPTPSTHTYIQGNNVMSVETAGSNVNMRMMYLNPSYWGTVRDENNNIVRTIRVSTREDFGVWNTIKWGWGYYVSHNADWDDFTNGQYTTVNLAPYAGEKMRFELSCRHEAAIAEFIGQAFVLPLLSFAGGRINMDNLSCLSQTIFSFTLDRELSATSEVLTSGFSSLNNNTQNNLILAAFQENADVITEVLSAGNDYLECYYQEMSERPYLRELARAQARLRGALFGTIGRAARLISGAETIGNLISRCIAFANAPDSISFCMEWYYNVSEDAHYCTTPELQYISGNGQFGKPDSFLKAPLKVGIVAKDVNNAFHARPLTLHLRVVEGNGELEDTLFNVVTEQFNNVIKQTRWKLGSDTAQPQRVKVWLTDPVDNHNPVSDTLNFVAFFNRVDSFRVKADRYVTFSKGNLQYQPSSKTWRFAEHQYDMIGMDNLNMQDGDTTYTGWIDLFSWFTGTKPTYVPTNNNLYNSSLNGLGEWGINPISNGGNEPNLWRTPDFSEWNYLLTQRPNATNLRTLATVVGVHGMIILPDNWQMPDSVEYLPDIHNFNENVYDTLSWARMESAGAIFLPAAGFRYRQSSLSSFSVYQLGVAGAYWSSYWRLNYVQSTGEYQRHAYRMAFFGSSGQFFPYQSVECYWGQSVRLIRTL